MGPMLRDDTPAEERIGSRDLTDWRTPAGRRLAGWVVRHAIGARAVERRAPRARRHRRGRRRGSGGAHRGGGRGLRRRDRGRRHRRARPAGARPGHRLALARASTTRSRSTPTSAGPVGMPVVATRPHAAHGVALAVADAVGAHGDRGGRVAGDDHDRQGRDRAGPAAAVGRRAALRELAELSERPHPQRDGHHGGPRLPAAAAARLRVGADHDGRRRRRRSSCRWG